MNRQMDEHTNQQINTASPRVYPQGGSTEKWLGLQLKGLGLGFGFSDHVISITLIKGKVNEEQYDLSQLSEI